jgi:hypothetical protein
MLAIGTVLAELVAATDSRLRPGRACGPVALTRQKMWCEGCEGCEGSWSKITILLHAPNSQHSKHRNRGTQLSEVCSRFYFVLLRTSAGAQGGLTYTVAVRPRPRRTLLLADIAGVPGDPC